MPWLYYQRTGVIQHNAVVIGTGYSGTGTGFNNSADQSKHNLGPIPRGMYTIGAPKDEPHNPYVLPLVPDKGNQMFGRSGFLIHGDSIAHPGAASQGCIILPRWIREKIVASKDAVLEVVE